MMEIKNVQHIKMTDVEGNACTGEWNVIYTYEKAAY
jgi:hypothetical protein